MQHIQSQDEVLDFWFNTLGPDKWFVKDDALDAQISKHFHTTHHSAHVGELYSWRESAEGRLAEIIVLDQFSRNMFRGLAQSFASDPIALVLAQELVASGLDQDLSEQQRVFAYMPYMHSESRLIHTQALALYQDLGLQVNLDYEIKHKEIIDRFGRYPHRNAILGRHSSAEELAFLKQPGSSF